ncbi:MAG: hypothetical protein GQ552_08435, partial [Flavobacteriaceae bacterium]|nr:hypothetical protein [Flavobacteriaceae bacterium]
NITNHSFEFTYNVNGNGEGYYVVVEGGSDAPSNEDVFNGTAAGLISSGSFQLTGESVTVEILDDLCDDSTFDVYAVQFTSDSFLSESPTLTSLTTAANNIEGKYDTVTNGVMSGNFDGEIIEKFTSVVTITDNGDGTFTFDDTTAGIYPAYYSAFAFIDPTFADPVPWTFDVPCNNMGAAYWSTLEAFGDYIIFDAIINADGTISVHWESAFGEVMDAVYTKQ